jgi:hypothetical protein
VCGYVYLHLHAFLFLGMCGCSLNQVVLPFDGRQVRTTIGFGSTKQGTEKVHGSPLGADDIKQVRASSVVVVVVVVVVACLLAVCSSALCPR